MFKTYLISVIIYYIIINCELILFSDNVKKNGWLEGKESSKHPYFMRLCMACIPIVRVFYVIAFMYLVLTPCNREK